MTSSDHVAEAIAAIGPPQADDWKIDPAAHAAELGATAPELASLLQRSEVASTATEYLDADSEAGDAQQRYRKTAGAANLAVLATACIAAAVMVLGTLDGAEHGMSWWFAVLGIAGIATGALATMWLSRIRDGGMLRRWTENRARAEAMRLEYFAVVLDVTAQNPVADKRLALLKLEYFRRFLLDSQLAYFKVHSKEHRQSADRNLSQITRWTALAAVLTGTAGLLAVKMPALAALAGGGMVATALATLFGNRASLDQDQANAQRYVNTRRKLVDISRELSATREMIVAGESPVLRTLYEATRDVLMAEHSQWLEGARSSDAAIERLHSQLEELGNKQAG